MTLTLPEYAEMLVLYLVEAGLPRAQAEKFGVGGLYEDTSRGYWKKGVTLDAAVRRELVGDAMEGMNGGDEG